MLRKSSSYWLIILALTIAGTLFTLQYILADDSKTTSDNNGNPPVTDTVAKQKVADLLTNSNATIDNMKLVPARGEVNYRPHYYMTASNGDTFRVDAANGAILSANYKKGFRSLNKLVNMDQAQEIALDFLRTHSYAFQAGLNMVAKPPELLDRMSYKEYRFEWREQKNNLDTPNAVVVLVDPETGAINSFQSSVYEAVTAADTPTVSKDEAIKLAIQKAGFNPTNTESKLQYGQGNKLEWMVELKTVRTVRDNLTGETGSSEFTSTVLVDALSGEIITEYKSK